MSVQVQPDVKELTKRLAAATVPDVGGATVHSREVAGGVHYLYESIRNATEFRDQHLFLRRAIERFITQANRRAIEFQAVLHIQAVGSVR